MRDGEGEEDAEAEAEVEPLSSGVRRSSSEAGSARDGSRVFLRKGTEKKRMSDQWFLSKSTDFFPRAFCVLQKLVLTWPGDRARHRGRASSSESGPREGRRGDKGGEKGNEREVDRHSSSPLSPLLRLAASFPLRLQRHIFSAPCL